MKIENIDIYQMELHEFLVFDECNTLVLRVPGGWIYSHLANKTSLVFIPYSSEFEMIEDFRTPPYN